MKLGITLQQKMGQQLVMTPQLQQAIKLLQLSHHEIAEHPEKLIVYGGRGQAARNPEALKKIIHALLNLSVEQTLLVP